MVVTLAQFAEESHTTERCRSACSLSLSACSFSRSTSTNHNTTSHRFAGCTTSTRADCSLLPLKGTFGWELCYSVRIIRRCHQFCQKQYSTNIKHKRLYPVAYLDQNESHVKVFKVEGWDGDVVFYLTIQKMPDEDTLTRLSEAMRKADRKPFTQPWHHVACLAESGVMKTHLIIFKFLKFNSFFHLRMENSKMVILDLLFIWSIPVWLRNMHLFPISSALMQPQYVCHICADIYFSATHWEHLTQ